MHINNFERPSTTICYNGGKQLIQEINSTYYLGEKPDGYVIHHIDKNKSNNK
ncbi:MAG: HNH endonuclease, partial [Clostridia bacterium]